MFERCCFGVLLLVAGILPGYAADVNEADHVSPALAQSWDFRDSAAGAGWRSGDPSILGLRVDRGKLVGEAKGGPAALLSPACDLRPAVTHVLEMRLRVSRETTITVIPLDSADGKPPASGAGEVSDRWTVPLKRSRRSQTVRLTPFWQGRSPIRRFLFELPDAGRFEIEWIRVIDLSRLPEPGAEAVKSPDGKKTVYPPPAPLPGPTWDFEWSAEGWTPATGIDRCQQWLGVLLAVTGTDEDPILLSPPTSLDAGVLPWLTLRLRVKGKQKQREAFFLWSELNRPGIRSVAVMLDGGDTFEELTVNLAEREGWRGKIGAVGLRLPTGVQVEVDYVRLGAAPLPDPAEVEPVPETTNSSDDRDQSGVLPHR